MPIITVPMDPAARAAYLEVYRAEAVGIIDTHMRAMWDGFQSGEPWIAMVYLHRAVQGYAYLNDPDADSHIDSRYPTVKSGVPNYGATYAEVAQGYVTINRTLTWIVANIYEDYRSITREVIPSETSKSVIDHYVNQFIEQHPVTDLVIPI